MAVDWLERPPALAKPWRRPGHRALFPRSSCMLPSLLSYRSGGGERMPHTLVFQTRDTYKPSDRGVSVPVSLRAGSETVHLFANIDTARSTAYLKEGLPSG